MRPQLSMAARTMACAPSQLATLSALARSRAMPRPTPRPPPVTSATFPSMTPISSASITLGKVEHFLGDEAQDQLLGDRREPRQRHLAIKPLDVVFLGIAEPAMGRDGLPCRIMAGTGAEEFGAVGFGAARPPGIVEFGGFHRHQPRGFEIHPFFRKRMLDALVLPDRPIEHDALLGVPGRPTQR